MSGTATQSYEQLIAENHELAARLRSAEDKVRALQHDQQVDRVRQSEARYAKLLNAMQEGAVTHDGNGSIQSCNSAAERILGLTAEQMMGRTHIDPRWRAIHEDGSPFPGETHPATVSLRTGQPVSNVVMGVHKPDGTLSWILIASPQAAQDQRQRGVDASALRAISASTGCA